VRLGKSGIQLSVTSRENRFNAADLRVMVVIFDLSVTNLIIQILLLFEKRFHFALGLPLEGRKGLRNKASGGNGDTGCLFRAIGCLIIGLNHAFRKILDTVKVLIGFRGKTLHKIELDLGFSTEVVGVRATGKAFAFSGDFFDRKGVKHAAEGEYDCEELELSPQAKVFLRDGEGRVLASVHRCGKGRVVVAAPKWLVPRMPADGNYAVHLTRTGRRRFSFIEHFLDGLQKTLFPVKVEGSAQFGLNRNSKGWWLWCFNNRGVKKFTDAPQEIDHSFDSALTIDVSRLGAVECRELISGRGAEIKNGSFSWTLPAGELAVFELQKGVEK
jgi:hypothetical protein